MSACKSRLLFLIPLSCLLLGNTQCSQTNNNSSNATARVDSTQKISSNDGGFNGNLNAGDGFGSAVASVSGLEGDLVTDLAVGAPNDDRGGTDRGAVWILFLNSNGKVTSEQRITDGAGGFTGNLDDGDRFGSSVADIGDLDGDGFTDLAVGAPGADDGGKNRGALWILFLNADGTVKSHQKISDTAGGFDGQLNDGDGFGSSVASLGDLDGDLVTDLAVGAPFASVGGSGRGAVWILFLNGNGKAKSELRIADGNGGFTGNLDDGDRFGSSVADIGDLDGDSFTDLAVGAPGADDGGKNRGALWILFLNADGTVKSHQKISDTAGGFDGQLNDGDGFGSAVASLGDIDGDGVVDLAVGAPFASDGGSGRGAVWILFMKPDGTVKARQKIAQGAGGFDGTLTDKDHFGNAVAGIGDLDGDGVNDLAVGADQSDVGGTDRGAVWVLFLNSSGRVKSTQRIADGKGGFDATLTDGDQFGSAVADVGDLDGDGRDDLAVGADQSDIGGTDRGAVWILFLKKDGRVTSWQRIGDGAGGFDGKLADGDQFGAAVAGIGNLDGNKLPDIAVGAPGDDDGGTDKGAVWILFMKD